VVLYLAAHPAKSITTPKTKGFRLAEKQAYAVLHCEVDRLMSMLVQLSIFVMFVGFAAAVQRLGCILFKVSAPLELVKNIKMSIMVNLVLNVCY